MRANTVWLWSQTAALVVVVAASITGLIVTAQTSLLSEELVVAINATFYGPGIALSLLINQIVLLVRRPLVVRPAERVVLSIEFAAIAALIIVSPLWELALVAAMLSIVLPAIAITALVLIIVGNVVTADARRAAAVFPVQPQLSGQ